MALPQAVQQAADQAEALQAQIYAETAEAPVATQTDPVVTPPETPPSNVVELPRQADPAPVETPRPAEQSDDAKYWKQKFDSLQGKFNAEVPQLHQQLREQSTQLAKLTELVQRRETPPPEEPQGSNDVEDFGPLVPPMVDRRAEAVARKIVAQEIAKLRQEFGVMQEQVGNVTNQVAMSEADRFWNEVVRLVPDWREVDENPAWIQWLDSAPDYSEDTFRSMAAKAISRGDAQKLAGLVKLWRGPQTQTPAPAPVDNPELLRQVTPPTSRASAPVQPAGKIWSAAEYQSAMDVRNVQRLGQAEADRLEAEATKAVAEGRVRWG